MTMACAGLIGFAWGSSAMAQSAEVDATIGIDTPVATIDAEADLQVSADAAASMQPALDALQPLLDST